MVTCDALISFYRVLEESPGDKLTLLALSDWFEDEGLLDHASCVRWTVARGFLPFRYTLNGPVARSSSAWHDGWYWWAVDDSTFANDWGHPPSCQLPRKVWDRLRHTFDYEPAVFKEYFSLREAYHALLDAWPLVAPYEKQFVRRERRR